MMLLIWRIFLLGFFRVLKDENFGSGCYTRQILLERLQTETQGQATKHDCLPRLLGDGD
jgi:hypothetical protein